MVTKESVPIRPQREADRRKRQAAALKANMKRRKATLSDETSPDKEPAEHD